MSSFLKDLPCRNPDSFTRFHSPGAVRQTSVRPTYSAKLDSNVKEIINDPVPLLIRRLCRMPVGRDESRKRSMPDDESEVPSFVIDTSKRTRQNLGNSRTTASSSTNTSQAQNPSTTNSLECDEEFS